MTLARKDWFSFNIIEDGEEKIEEGWEVTECYSSDSFIMTGWHFHFNRRTKNGTEGFLLKKDVFAALLAGFGESLF